MTSTSISKLYIPLLVQFIVTIASAQNVTISPEGQVKVLRGGTLNITCTDRTSTMNGNAIVIDRNGQEDSSVTRQSIDAEVTFFLGPFTLDDNGTVFRCAHSGFPVPPSPDVILDIQHAPDLSVKSNVVESSLTGTAVFNYTVQANPAPSPPVVFRDGIQVVDGITISDTSVTFSDIRCRDNGTYTLQSTNAVGSSNVTFSLVVMRSPPIWLVNRIFEEDSILINASEVIIACPEELLSVSCVFSDSEVQFTTTFNATTMTLELSVTPATVEGNSITVTANANCTASNQEGATPSSMLTVQRTIAGTGPTGLSPGQIAGIAVGSIVGVIIIVGIVIAIIIGIWWCWKKR